MDLFEKCITPGVGNFSALRDQNDNYYISPKLEGKAGPRMTYGDKEVVVWSINSYLGMHQTPEYINAAQSALDCYGAENPMGSRLMSGNSQLHCQLEDELADFVGQEQANLGANGYLGVIGTIGALVGPDDYIVADRQCHACIIDGMKLAASPGQYRTYNHNDMLDLEKILANIRKKHTGGILLITEGLFGMSGEIAPLGTICELKERYHARLMIDDAHGFGTIGKTGRGAAEYHGVLENIDVFFSTFAKTFAGIGCFSASKKEVSEFIKFNARSMIFTKSLPIVYASTARAVLGKLKSDGRDLVQMLTMNALKLQQGLQALGFNLGSLNGPITPVHLPNDMGLCLEVVSYLREHERVFVSAVTYPVIPKNQFLLRLVPTVLHNREDIDWTLSAFNNLIKKYPSLRR